VYVAVGAMWDVISGMMLSETNSITAEFAEAVWRSCQSPGVMQLEARNKVTGEYKNIRESNKYYKM